MSLTSGRPAAYCQYCYIQHRPDECHYRPSAPKTSAAVAEAGSTPTVCPAEPVKERDLRAYLNEIGVALGRIEERLSAPVTMVLGAETSKQQEDRWAECVKVNAEQLKLLAALDTRLGEIERILKLLPTAELVKAIAIEAARPEVVEKKLKPLESRQGRKR